MIVGFIALGITLCSLAYVVLAIFRVRRFARELPRFSRSRDEPPVTLLKPIYQGDPQLLDNLRSCCRQNYPTFQIIFGFRFEDDPAIPIVRQIMEEFPGHDLKLVVDPTVIGPNLKVSSLSNMERYAKYDLLIIADSDMRVPEDYLSRVVSPFTDSEVGAVTCIYRGASAGNVCSRLAAMFVNDWFLPSVLVSSALNELRYCFGATMAVRRDVFQRAGGFSELADFLADDYVLGQRVFELGYKIRLAPCVVENFMEETRLADVWSHELRWSRTMRAVEPVGFAFAALTDLIPISLVSGFICYLAFGPVPAAAVVAVSALARFCLHYTVVRCFSISQGGSGWLVVGRDFLTAGLRIWSYVPGPVVWRGYHFDIDSTGRLIPRGDLHNP
jgi:ceramide glucosyltransferase